MTRKRKLPLNAAYAFARQNGLDGDAEAIKLDSSLTTRARRARMAALFEDRGLLPLFVSALWQPASDRPGKNHPAESLSAPCFELASSTQADGIAAALAGLVNVQRSLRDLGAIRSQRIVGDLGEWIASQVLQLPICANPVQTGWDLAGDGLRVQVKTHAKARIRSRRTNLKADALNYDGLAIVALSSHYRLRAVYVIPLSHVSSVACNTKQRRLINWSSVSQYGVSAVPSALAPLLSNDSGLVADDAAHRSELVELRARIARQPYNDR